MKITKNNYLAGFAAVVIILALVRCIHPKIAEGTNQAMAVVEQNDSLLAEQKDEKQEAKEKKQEVKEVAKEEIAKEEEKVKEVEEEMPVVAQVQPVKGVSRFINSDGSIVKHRILSVPRYLEAFPDSQPLQERAAARWGVKPVNDREDAESRKKELAILLE